MRQSWQPCASFQAGQADTKEPPLTLTVDPAGGPPVITLSTVSGSFGPIPPPKSRRLIGAPQPADVALFLHTSGTTSRPKVTPRPLHVSLDYNRFLTCNAGVGSPPHMHRFIMAVAALERAMCSLCNQGGL